MAVCERGREEGMPMAELREEEEMGGVGSKARGEYRFGVRIDWSEDLLGCDCVEENVLEQVSWLDETLYMDRNERVEDRERRERIVVVLRILHGANRARQAVIERSRAFRGDRDVCTNGIRCRFD
jgi:hypothetical protein